MTVHEYPSVKLCDREYSEPEFHEAKWYVLKEYWDNDIVVGVYYQFYREGARYIVAELDKTPVVTTPDIHEAMDYFVALETPKGLLDRFHISQESVSIECLIK